LIAFGAKLLFTHTHAHSDIHTYIHKQREIPETRAAKEVEESERQKEIQRESAKNLYKSNKLLQMSATFFFLPVQALVLSATVLPLVQIYL